jgi:Stress responsive A/B Barrel Domain
MLRRANRWRYAPQMLRHVNLLTWKDGTEQTAIEALSEHLSGYAAQIVEIRDLSFGSDLRLAGRNADFAIIVDFDDEDAFSRYLAHPAHGRMVGEFLKPIVESRHAVQFQVSPAR